MEVIRILLEHASDGMIVARDIFNENKQMIIPENTILTQKKIESLRSYGIYSIFIKTTKDAEEAKQITVSYMDSIRESADFKEFNDNYTTGVFEVSKNLSEIVEGNKEIDKEQLFQSVDSALNSVRYTARLLDMIQCIQAYDDLTYVHSMNVAIICAILGGWLRYSEEDIKVLVLSGLLHDVGKLQIPQDIILKEGSLTPEEYEIVKTHPLRGYEILRHKKIDIRIKCAALMHHEKNDGSGYPYGLKGDKIQEFAQIVTIADVYDAMTSTRCYRKAICPFDVVEMFQDGGLLIYNPRFLLVFLEHIVDSYINSTVLLSNAQIGEIIMINKQALTRPIVRVDDEFIDLSRRKDIKIVEIL